MVYSSFENPMMNRGYAFIEFESNGAAAVARKNFRAGGIHLFQDSGVYVEWAKPEPISKPSEISQVNLHIMLIEKKRQLFSCKNIYFQNFKVTGHHGLQL